MNSKLNRLVLALASTTILIAGCGGGGGGSSSGVGGGAGSTTGVAVTVVDGAIQNAVVCLDKNGNGSCDADEQRAAHPVAHAVDSPFPSEKRVVAYHSRTSLREGSPAR
jgi:hypothetical protein